MVPFYLKENIVEADDKIAAYFKDNENLYKVIDPKGNENFNVIFNGKLYEGVIGWENKYPPKLLAFSASTSEKILLFDGMIHGYDSAIGFNRKIVVRGEEQKYIDKQNESEFEVYISFDYDSEGMDDEEQSEFYNDIFENDKDWFVSNSINDAAKLTTCCFTSIAIYIVNKFGIVTKILEEETA